MSKPSLVDIQFQLRVKPRAQSDAGERNVPYTGRLPRVTQVLALAIHLENLIRQGDAKDYADVARLSCLCRERISQIVRLNYLAPDIQIDLLYLPPAPTGRFPISESAVRKIACVLSWEEQRRAWRELKIQHNLA
jgi:hypothetical protein